VLRPFVGNDVLKMFAVIFRAVIFDHAFKKFFDISRAFKNEKTLELDALLRV